MLDRSLFERLDAEDPLSRLVEQFALPEGAIYLDGNSLGPLPSHVPAVIQNVVNDEWGRGLIRSWNRKGWWYLANSIGDQLAPLIGAPQNTIAVGDTTTVALYKAASAACGLRPGRKVVLTDSGNFPSDLYVLRSVAEQMSGELIVVEPGQVADRIDESVALVALTHVDYRTARRHDMAVLTNAAHECGAMIVWDLAHSAGAMDLDLTTVDMAVGCGYKYLNGGPGAPAFLYVRPDLIDTVQNPIRGWWGHDEPFAMTPEFVPASGINRMQVGTQPIIALAALGAALEVFDGVDPVQLRRKSENMTDLFIRLIDDRINDLEVVTPRDSEARGSHVSLAHTEANQFMVALGQYGLIGDVRPPNLLRFGLAPTYQRYVDVWNAVEVIEKVITDEEWRTACVPAGPVT